MLAAGAAYLVLVILALALCGAGSEHDQVNTGD